MCHPLLGVQDDEGAWYTLLDDDYSLLDEFEINSRILSLEHQIGVLTEAADCEDNERRRERYYEAAIEYEQELEALRDEWLRREEAEEAEIDRKEALRDARRIQDGRNRIPENAKRAPPTRGTAVHVPIGKTVGDCSPLPRTRIVDIHAGTAARRPKKKKRIASLKHVAKRPDQRRGRLRIVIEY